MYRGGVVSTHPADVRACFDRFDKNRSGKLDYRELRTALSSLGVDLSTREAVEVLAKYDSNRSGVVEIGEFASMVARLRQHMADKIPRDIRNAFNGFDKNRSGQLDYRELRNALLAVGVDVSSQEAANMLRKYDSDRNGLLAIDEFAVLVHQLRQYMAAQIPHDVRDAFNSFDKNRSGQLDYRELRNALQRLGLDVSAQEAVNVLARYDANRNGLLDVGEFWVLVHQLRQWQQSQAAAQVPADVRDAFNGFDRNRSGQLDYRELRNALKALGLDTSAQEAVNVLAKYDADRNGLLDVREFAALVHQLREYMARQYQQHQQHQQRAPSYEQRPAAAISAEVRAAFERFDKNRSGRLDYREVRNALQAMGLDVDTNQAAHVLRRYDADGSGMLEIDEFSSLVWQLRAELFPQRASGIRVALYILSTPVKAAPLDPHGAHARRGGGGGGHHTAQGAYGAHGASASRAYEQQAREARSYCTAQQLEMALGSAISQAVSERASDGISRVAEILSQGRHARLGGVEMQATSASSRVDEAEARAADLANRLRNLQEDAARDLAALKQGHRAELARVERELEALRAARQQQDAELRAAFDRFDKNRSGKLDYRELRNALAGVGLDTDLKDAVAILKKYDNDRSGLLEFDEFCTLVRQLRVFMADQYPAMRAELKQLHAANAQMGRAEAALAKAVPANIRDAFYKFDQDGSGDIDTREISPALRLLGLQGDTGQAMGVISNYDKTGSGKLTIFDFNSCVQELLKFQKMTAPTAPPVAVARPSAGASFGRAGNRNPF